MFKFTSTLHGSWSFLAFHCRSFILLCKYLQIQTSVYRDKSADMSLNYHCTCVCCDCCCLSPVCYLCCRACQNLGRYCPKLVYLCLESCAFLTDVSLRSLRSFCNAAFCTQTFLIQKNINIGIIEH